MGSTPLPDALLEALTLFDEGGEPMTTTEVAERIGLGRWSTDERLERLVEHDRLETKNVGGNERVWWQPSTEDDDLEGSERDDQFQALVDATEEYAIFMLDPEGHVKTWNPGAERIKGYGADDIVGEHFSEFYTDDDRAAGVPENNLREATRRGSTEDEGRRVRADGSEFWANVTISTIRDDDGEIRGYSKVTRDMSERQEYERRLEEQADRLKRQRDELESELDEVFERISDGVYALDDDLRFLYLNDHATDVLGLDETAIGADIRDEISLTEPFENALREALETQGPVFLEDYYGSVNQWFYNAIYPSESGVSVYFRDITEQKQREHELKRYETTVETLWDGVTTLDADERFVMVNEAFCEMTGYDRDEILGEPATLILDERAYEDASELHDLVVEGELDIATLEYDLPTADGGSIPVEARFGPCEFEDGTIGGTGVIRDVTERKARERTLERRARQQQVVADLGQFALETDDLDELMHEAASQVATALDNEYCKVLDLHDENEELLLRQGVGWTDGIVGVATVSSVEADSQAAYTLANDHPIVVDDLETETRFSGPELLRSHDVRSGISTVIGSFDEPWGILGTHDTRRRTFTDEDVNFVQSVANVLAEAIERRRYQQALERNIAHLEESNKRLEQFAYAASHDLQEPLRMVSSYLQLIERRYGDAFDEDGREFLAFAVDGADRMRAMIDGLLQYSRVETEGGEFEPIDLERILEDVRDNLRVKIEENDAEITAEQLPRVRGDEKQLQQVFQNLLANAIEYSGDEPPRVHVTAERKGSDWTVSVADEGIGIKTDDQERIFEIFHRLHSHENHAGSGIGLALCKRIVERHGGEIRVDSESGDGATFSFTVPAASDRNT